MENRRAVDQMSIENQVFARAERMDFRDHCAERFELQADGVEELLSCSLNESQNLELIVLKVMHRPDEFGIPSLSSVFPFLEAMCPKEDPAWCIHSARQLDLYDAAWVMSDKKQNSTPEANLSMVSFRGRIFLDVEHIVRNRDSFFVLVLIPRSWVVEDINDLVIRVSSRFTETEKPVGTTVSREQAESILNDEE
ncbi:hypothetical protein P170DRAFT_474991 [Aspergillus steynii IBT 23096]|uniref:Uncharacterized protein n=1 Tax=Aspergillus steynii IBT 23096 TaxID=1392250 RepID=A0A2I2G6Y6_9EURO|nr:uncharacterized protein P170DRAFT_474991 [Aspergillus steynii IBT 23096]PLB48638.1 hypothetical protein P170DRAFT_474991 [Aspergillus steynii IBT 23096]